MMKIKFSLEEFQERSFAFNEQMDALSLRYYDYVRSVTVDGEPIESLNDLARIDSFDPEHGRYTAILHYFTPIDIPENIKADIEAILDSLFYE